MKFNIRISYILILIIVACLTIGLIWFNLYKNIIPTQENSINLIDIKQNISNYMKNITTCFYIIDIKARPDPQKWLLDEYYLVKIKDEWGNEAEFVICKTDLLTYQQYVGKKTKFVLQGNIIPELMVPYRRLLTNILFSEPVNTNDLSLGYYMIKIYLIHEGS